MKILKIELQNINSLKCETPIVIDFEHQRFEDVGLYAITGPTGAGKTTLLDAITIALYRRVPRFEKSSGKGGLEDCVSYGAATAMARVTFEVQNQRYEAHWDIRTASNSGRQLGKPVETVRLKNLSSGKILAETKTGCEEQIIEITKLNYDQFLRSVLLAQGEFAAFLSAKNTEKGLLLQQIAGDEIYRKIGETLKNRIFDERRILDQIKSRINTADLLSEEETRQLESDKNHLADSILELNAGLKKAEELLKWYDQKNKLYLQKQNIEANKQQLEIERSQQIEVFEQLEKHEAAEPYQATLTEVIRLEKDIENKTIRIRDIEKELDELTGKLRTATEEAQNCKLITSENEQRAKEWQPKLDKVTELDTQIRSHLNILDEKKLEQLKISREILELEKSANNITEELKQQQLKLGELILYIQNNPNIPAIEKQQVNWNTQLTQRKSNHERMADLIRQIAASKQHIADNNIQIETVNNTQKTEQDKLDLLNAEIKELQVLLDKSDIENLLSQNNTLNTQKGLLGELIQLSDNYHQFIENQENYTTRIKELEQKLAEISLQIQNTEKEIETQTKLVADAEELYEKDRYIVSLEAERKKLKLGEPCALCGSKEHPLVVEYAEIEISDSRKRLDERRAELLKLQTTKHDSGLNYEKQLGEFNHVTDQQKQNKEALQNVIRNFNDKKSIYRIEEKTNLVTALNNTENELKETARLISVTQDSLKTKDEKLKLAKSLEEKITNYKIELTRLTTDNSGTEKSISEKVKTGNETKIANQELERRLASELSKCGLQLPETEYTEAFIRQLESSVKIYNDNANKIRDIENKIEQVNIEIKNINKQLSSKKDETATLETIISDLKKNVTEITEHRTSILPVEISTDKKRSELHTSIDVSKKEEENAIKKLNELKELKAGMDAEKRSLSDQNSGLMANLDRLKTTFEEMISESIFSNREELSVALLTEEIKSQHLRKRKLINERTISLSSLEKENTSELEKLEKGLIPDTTEEETQIQANTINEQKEKLQKSLGEIAEKFRKDAEIKRRNFRVVDEINLQEQVCRKWTTLMTILGGSQDAFNTYVQRLTLKNLIDLANLHLYKLNRRYSLQLNPHYKIGEELNFKLVDHYQADEIRLVDTSSGGEKFLISLALALGLSDLASYNVSIGTLFIDEGFGSLDSNTLETVISTLETLKAQGKMIGIISHVDSLKERIPVQIQVLKKSNGVSTVTIC